MCQPKRSGGMRFRTIIDFNLALLAKKDRCIISYPNYLLVRCLKRYFPHRNLLKASLESWMYLESGYGPFHRHLGR